MGRRPTPAHVAATIASLSINAILWLGLRQVGGLPDGSASNDGDATPLFVIDLGAAKPGPRARAERRSKAPLGAARRHAGLAAPKTAAPAIFAGDNAGAPPEALTVVSDDRWDRHATGDAISGLKTDFQRSLEGPGPDFERKSALASLPFHEHGIGALLSGMTKGADCRELEAALARHRESARVIVQTMQRIGCHS
jgi:hypothetical protein